MAAPVGVTLSADDIAITQATGLGIESNTPSLATGTIEAIGSGVTGWAVNDVVLFNKDGFFTDQDGFTFAICNKSELRFKYVAV